MKKKPETVIRELIKALKECDCMFWACEGPKTTYDMITCRKCLAIHDAQQWLKKNRKVKNDS